jgi:Protein of unknown function (DUF3995)
MKPVNNSVRIDVPPVRHGGGPDPSSGQRPRQEAAAHTDASSRPVAARRAVWTASVWAIVFVALHGYWALGGRVGFGDQKDPIPLTTSSIAGWVFTVVVALMFVAGLVVPLALVQQWGRRAPRHLLLAMMWIGVVVLGARGVLGLLDGLLRGLGVDGGLTGLSYEHTLGTAHPTTYTLWSAAAIDLVFLVGGILFAAAALLTGLRPPTRGARVQGPEVSRR